MAKRSRNCIWHCGRGTENISGVCTHCWTNREAIYQARKARGAQAEKKPRTAKQKEKATTEKLIATRMAKLTKDLPAREASAPEDSQA
jgi:hypothetical protein